GSAFTIEAGVMYNRELPAIKSDRLAHVILLHVFIKHPLLYLNCKASCLLFRINHTAIISNNDKKVIIKFVIIFIIIIFTKVILS
ncbi:hypothetical protein BEU28_28610, partial [Bacillus anthracis]